MYAQAHQSRADYSLLTEPVTLRDTDGYFGYRNGRTRGYLVEGLKLYVELFKPRKGVN